MNAEFLQDLQAIAREKDIPLEVLVETVESALATAYKKNANLRGEFSVKIAQTKGAASLIQVYQERTVVELSEEHELDADFQVSLADAKKVKPGAELGDIISTKVERGGFGRIEAQTAKQVLVQRIREAERKKILDEYSEKIGEVVTGTVSRREGRSVLVSFGKLDAVMPAQEQVESEPYKLNDRIRVYVLEVREMNKGPQIIVSRTHPSLIRRLFELEVPEIEDGVVTIKSVAREPGARSKIAVTSRDEKVDPVGSCVGHRGSRVQAVVNELYDEKIDIVRWNADEALFIGEALSPAKSVKVTLNHSDKSAFVVVPDTQLSLAIGKSGQNVRLAARLTGWRIDIRSEAQVAREQLLSMTGGSGIEGVATDEGKPTRKAMRGDLAALMNATADEDDDDSEDADEDETSVDAEATEDTESEEDEDDTTDEVAPVKADEYEANDDKDRTIEGLPDVAEIATPVEESGDEIADLILQKSESPQDHLEQFGDRPGEDDLSLEKV